MVPQVSKKEPRGHTNHSFSLKNDPFHSAVNMSSCWNFNCDGLEGPAAGGEALKIYTRRTPEGGNGVMKPPSKFFANLQNLHLSAAPPLPPAPAKSMSKTNLKSDPNKTLQKFQKKMSEKNSQKLTGASGRPGGEPAEGGGRRVFYRTRKRAQKASVTKPLVVMPSLWWLYGGY